MTDRFLISNCNRLTEVQTTQLKTCLSEITPSSSIWQQIECYDVNNDKMISYSEIPENEISVVAKLLGILPDGEIGGIQQGEIGDCWLLGDAVSLSLTKQGKESIKNAIDYNHLGTSDDPYIVYLINTEGKKIEISLTEEELQNYKRKKYSNGDIDIKMLEVAIEKYFDSERAKGIEFANNEELLDGGIPNVGKYSVTWMLTGQSGKGLTSSTIRDEFKDSFSPLTKDTVTTAMEHYADNQSNIAFTCSFSGTSVEKESSKPSLFGFLFDKPLIGNHCYTVSGVIKNCNGNIELVRCLNTHDTHKEILIPYEKFLSSVDQISYIEFE